MSCSLADVVNQKGLPRGMAILTSHHRDLHDQGGGFAPITHVHIETHVIKKGRIMGLEAGQETSAGCKLYFKMTIMKKSTL